MNTIKSGELNAFKTELNAKYNNKSSILFYNFFHCGPFCAAFHPHAASISGSHKAESGDAGLSGAPAQEGDLEHQPGSR